MYATYDKSTKTLYLKNLKEYTSVKLTLNNTQFEIPLENGEASITNIDYNGEYLNLVLIPEPTYITVSIQL